MDCAIGFGVFLLLVAAMAMFNRRVPHYGPCQHCYHDPIRFSDINNQENYHDREATGKEQDDLP